MINNVVVKSWTNPPMMVGMADRNEDDLNQYNRKSLPDLMKAALDGTNKAYHDVARPTADIVVPTLSEYDGQLMQQRCWRWSLERVPVGGESCGSRG